MATLVMEMFAVTGRRVEADRKTDRPVEGPVALFPALKALACDAVREKMPARLRRRIGG
jgi:hypothetical protein